MFPLDVFLLGAALPPASSEPINFSYFLTCRDRDEKCDVETKKCLKKTVS